ncbi:MAG: hypothetical protein ACN6I4_00705 [bacterium]
MEFVTIFKKAILPNPSKGNINANENYYYPTGSAGIVGKLVAYSLTVCVAFVLALIYNFLIVFIPFPYINFFITLGMGIVLGYSTKVFSKMGKLRNYRERAWIGLFAGIVVYYFQWASFVMFALLDFDIFIDFPLYIEIIVSPLAMFETIALINKIGTWSIFSIPFNGIILTLVWIVEGLIIIAVPFILVRVQPLTPFSEILDKWYKLYRINHFFERVPQTFAKTLEEEGVNAIYNLGKGEANRYGRISIYYLEDEEYAYISADNIRMDRDGKNEDISGIVDAFKIDNTTAKELLEKYSTKKLNWLEH